MLLATGLWYDTFITTLILTIFFGLIIAFFATQNTGSVTLNLLTYSFSVPIYVVVVGALLVGLLFSWLVIMAKSITTGFAMRGKEHKITDYKKENAELLRQIHQLEITNARLETAANLPSDEKSL